MSIPPNIAASAQELWYHPRSHSDEYDSSWLLRTACIYGVTPQEMYTHLRSFNRDEFLDGFRKIDSGESLNPENSDDNGSTTFSRLGSYCPICFSRDIYAGEMPWFRRSWHHIWRTHCPVDKTPLFYWPYRQNTGHVYLPPWVAKVHLSQERKSINLRNEAREFTLQLRLARMVRRWVTDNDSSALAWRQQLDQEHVLLNEEKLSYALTGLSMFALRRATHDTVKLLCNSFGSYPRCQAVYLAGFLGPKWLFEKSFADSPPLSGHDLRSIRSFPDPAQRRSLITIAMRLLTSFASDPEFDRDARLLNVGETALTRALDCCPQSAARWVNHRSRNWPEIVSLGLRKALRMDRTF